MNKKEIIVTLMLFLLVSLVFFVPLSSSQKDFSVTGMVVSSSSGLPVSSVWVKVIKDGKHVAGKSLTGDHGRYYISSLTKGSYELIVIERAQEVFKSQFQLTEDTTFDIRL